MNLSKKLVTMGLAMSLGVMSVVPAFAATTVNKDAFEALQDNESSTEGVDYHDDLDGTFGTQDNAQSTEVGVQQAMSYVVTIPSFISLAGAKGAANEANFNVTVTGDISGEKQINVKPDLTLAQVDGVASGETYTAFTDGTGTFALKEDGGIKKDLVATITLADTDWAIKTDNKGDDTLEGVHAGKVSVADLKAGTFRNTINFDVDYVDYVAVP